MPIFRTALLSLAVLLAGAATLGAATDGFRAFTTESARRLEVREHPVAVADVLLEDQSGTRLRFASWRGRWLLVDFIYTRCPTYCLALGGDFAQLQRLLAAPLAQDRVRLLSVSFDPAHDTPVELAAYQHRFGDRGPGWIAARPVTAAGLRQLEHAFGISVVRNSLGGYTHNAALHLVDPFGRLVEILDAGKPQAAAEDLERRLGP